MKGLQSLFFHGEKVGDLPSEELVGDLPSEEFFSIRIFFWWGFGRV